MKLMLAILLLALFALQAAYGNPIGGEAGREGALGHRRIIDTIQPANNNNFAYADDDGGADAKDTRSAINENDGSSECRRQTN